MILPFLWPNTAQPMQMAMCLQRMGHRSIGLCLKVWKLRQAEESYALIQQVMQNALETQVKFENHATGLTQLRQVFRRFLSSMARTLTQRWRDRNKMHQARLAAEHSLVLHENIRFEAELGAERVAERAAATSARMVHLTQAAEKVAIRSENVIK